MKHLNRLKIIIISYVNDVNLKDDTSVFTEDFIEGIKVATTYSELSELFVDADCAEDLDDCLREYFSK